jgi:hypothetical protein
MMPHLVQAVSPLVSSGTHSPASANLSLTGLPTRPAFMKLIKLIIIIRWLKSLVPPLLISFQDPFLFLEK